MVPGGEAADDKRGACGDFRERIESVRMCMGGSDLDQGIIPCQHPPCVGEGWERKISE